MNLFERAIIKHVDFRLHQLKKGELLIQDKPPGFWTYYATPNIAERMGGYHPVASRNCIKLLSFWSNEVFETIYLPELDEMFPYTLPVRIETYSSGLLSSTRHWPIIRNLLGG